jgi:hypothetical protein
MVKHVIFTIFLCIILASAKAQDIQKILHELPKDDRQDLEELFHLMMYEDCFSYTLFGDKPVSLSGDFIVTPYKNILSGLKAGGIFWKKWSVWKKHQEKFSINNYLFIEEPAYNKPKNRAFIFFINKKAFLKIVNKKINIFNKILKNNLTATELLEKIKIEQQFMSVIQESEILLGILLGYGEHNAKLYDRRMKLKEFLSAPNIIEKSLSVSEGFSSIQEEYSFLNERLQSFENHAYSPLILPPIHFAADLSLDETQRLKKKYRRLQGQISSQYAQHDNFLEFVLFQLTAPASDF